MRIRTRLFCTCAVVLVMGTVAAVLPADAQGGFLGNITSSSSFGGSNPQISRSGTSDIIDVYSTQSVIDWRPSDQNGTGPIDFLPAGNTVTYRNGVSTTFTDFTVLNRIQPVSATGTPTSRVINLNGLIQSQINGTTAGSVWFYTPGGIVVGSTGVFNVGSLVLTSNPIDTTGGLFGAGNTIRFRGTAGSTTGVTINAGAQINATPTNSYVALVAPRVVQGGTVSVNGSTAYVGAEQADIRINGGLFDIDIIASTTDPNGVVHTGTTTGPASTAPTDRQNIYMVAVPKNNALTMLLSGTMGYPAASSVAQDSNAVVLSAGYSTAYSTMTGQLEFTPSPATTATTSVSLGAGSVLSALSIYALNDITVAPTASLQFNQAATMDAGSSISLTAGTGVSINALNGLSLRAGNGATGGSISLAANGAVTAPQGQGLIDVTGLLNANSIGSGNQNQLDAIGGPVSFTANRGTINADTLNIQTVGNAASNTARSGDATGGDASLSVSNNGQMNFTTTTINASGNSIFDGQVLPTDGGDATGGTIRFSGNGGALNLGEVRATAQATSGSVTNGVAGDATGGNIIVDLRSGTHDWILFLGDVTTIAGFSRLGQGTAASATPGATGILVDISGTAALNIAQSVSLYGDALNFGGSDVAGVTQGAPIRVQARDGGALQITRDLYIRASASARNSGFGMAGNVSNSTLGGTVLVGGLGGTFSAAGLFVGVTAESAGGAVSSGSANGGNVTLAATRSSGLRGNLSLTDCINFGCAIDASAFGAGGASNGIGGTILAYSSDADMTLGSLSLNAEGQGGSSFQPASEGVGGTISIESRRGILNDGTLSIDSLSATASGSPHLEGESSNLSNRDSSTGSGGSVTLALDGGTFTADTVSLTVDGTGADAGASSSGTTPFQAGTGTGGSIGLLLNGANATIGTLTLSANGTGGEAEGPASRTDVGAIAGEGRGGTATFTATAGTLTVNSLTVEAKGTGGKGRDAQEAGTSSGGAGVGGTAQFVMDVGSSATVNVTDLSVSASGQGGAGGNIVTQSNAAAVEAGAGGDGTGGTADFLLAGGTLNTPLVQVQADGIGGTGGINGSDGDGGAAGNGIGGDARLRFASEGHDIDVISITAAGTGGAAGDAKNIIGYDQFDDPIYGFGIGQGGSGGSGSGGRANMLLDVDPVLTTLRINADGLGTVGGIGATGGNGGAGNGGTNGLGAQLTVSFGSLTVTDLLEITAEGFGGAGGNGTTGRGGDGGIGTGGEAGLLATGGNTQVQTDNILQIISYGLGGDGGESGTTSGGGLPGGNGAAAFGGTAGLQVSDNAQFTFGQTTLVSAGAIGGTGRSGTQSTASGNGGNGGSGGNATGGIARLAVSNATVRDGADGDVEIYAAALAGVGGPGADDDGIGGRGGDAVGGLAQFESASGTVALNAVTVVATANGGGTGYGPLGNAGGNAEGGTASADFFNFGQSAQPLPGTATFASLALSAEAYGGIGGGGANGLGGTGGNATGGTTAASADGAGIVTSIDAFRATATALGGNAGTPVEPGIEGANGGTATGGRARFVATGNSQTTFGAPFSLRADATGGIGGNSAADTIGSKGGDGGTAQGGDARFTINAAQVRASGLLDHIVSAQATGGLGGNGGNGSGTGASGGVGGNGGDGTGGLALFSATDGDFDLSPLSILANGTGGLGGDGGTGPGFPGNPSATPPVPPSGPIQSSIGLSGGGIGGIAQLLNSDTGTLVSGALRSLSGVTMEASGIFPPASFFGFGPTTGRIDITDTSTAAGGGLVVNNTLTADAFGGGSCACSGIYVSSSVNPIQTGNAFLSTDAAMSFAFASSGSFRASGILNAYSGSTITVTQGSQGATPVDSLFGDILSLNAQGDILAGARTILRAGSDMDISSQAGSVELSQLFSGGTIDVTTVSGPIGIGNATANDTLTATSGTSMIANFLTSTTGDIVLTTLAGQAQVGDSSAARDFRVDATGGGIIQSGTVRAGRNLNFAGDSVTVGTAIVGDDIDLTARTGQVSLQNGTTTGIGATSGSNITVRAATDAVVFNGTAIDDIIIAGNTSAFVSTSATAGRDILVTATNGNAFVNGLNAGRNIDVTAATNLLVLSATAGQLLNLNAQAGTAEGGGVTGGQIVINGDRGINFSQVSSGGTTALTAENGAILLPDLSSVDTVSATGQSINLTGTGTLNFTSATATAGDLNLTAGTLRVTTGSASNDITLTSTSGSLNAGTLSGRNITVTSADAATLTGPLTIGGTLQVNAIGALTLPGSATAVNDILLDAGSVTGDMLTAGSVLNVSASGAVTLGTATSNGNATIIGGAGVDIASIASATGDITLTSINGTVRFVTANAARDLIANAGGAVQQTGTGTSAARAGRDILLTGPIIDTAALNAGRTLNLNATGTLSGGTLTTAGDVLLTSGGALNIGNLTSGASLQAISGGALTLGTATSIGNASVNGAAGVDVASVTSTAGDITLASSNGNVSFVTANAARDLIANAGGATGAVRQTGTGTSGARAGRDILLAGPIIDTAALNAGRTLNLNAARALSSGALAAGSDVLLNSGGALNVSGAVSGASLRAVSGTRLALGGPVRITGNASVQAGTTASIDDLDAGGAATINGQQGITARLLTSGGVATLTAANGAVALDTLTSRDAATVNAGTDVSLGATTATGALRITAQRTARFTGATTAPTIEVASGDIVIGSGARLGLQGTTRNLTLRAAAGQQGRNYIGGSDQAGAYSLSDDEMARLFVQDILINPQGQSTIGSFTLTAGTNGNLGPNGVLTINSDGRMEVTGAVQLTGLGPQGGLTLRSGNGIDVFTDTGSIDLRGSGTTLGGVLTMEGASVAVTTRSAIAGITGTNVSLDSRNGRLGQNDGAVSEDGFLRAGSIRLNVIQGAYIQNSGAGTAFADRRGFTANSFAVNTEGSGTEIIINGRLTDSLGGFVTGADTVPLVSINGVAGGQAGAYADRSTINGCLIGNVASCKTVEVPMTPDNRDSIDRVLDPTISVSEIFPVAIVELRDFVAEGYPPLIDEPVTGAGNEDLWDSDCNVSDDKGCGDPVAQ